MATNAIRELKMPDGSSFEFYGRTWYGESSSSATASAKTVYINGFPTTLYTGLRVIVRFSNAQTYNGIPTLNVSGTGAKNIYNRTGVTAVRYEWNQGAVIGFVYYANSNAWVIEDGGHATIDYWGKTKLTNTISANEQGMALTPKAVYDAGFLTLADLPIYDGSVE